MPRNKVDLGELFYKQKGLCYWCKLPMVLGGIGDRSATREHLIPRAHGGKSFVKRGRKRVRNIVAACRKCNGVRGSTDAHVFRSAMRPQSQLDRDNP